jgi:hypothetical protein
MDQERFDRITKTLASERSRRGVLRGLAGGLLAGAGSLIVGRSALADHTPSHCAHEGEKEQLNRNNPKSCCAGLAPDANGRCQPIVAPVVCPDAVLAGASGPLSSSFVDDDLQVFVNGESVFVDPNPNNANNITPIALGELTNGDTLRLVATDSTTSCGGAEQLNPITLYCPSRGTSQVLVATTVVDGGDPCGNVFYDESFTVAL